MANQAKLRRAIELFEEGEPLNLAPEGKEPEWVYVHKPNGFEHEEAIMDGRVARALYLEMYRPGSKERRAVEATGRGLGLDELVEAIILGRGNDLFMKAHDEVRARKDWADRLVLLDRAQVLAPDARPEERAALEEVQVDFYRALGEEQERLICELRRELSQEAKVDRQAVEQTWLEGFIKNQASGEFLTARQQTDIYFAFCAGEVRQKDGKEVVEKGERMLEDRTQVRTLPDGLLECVVSALDRVNMSQKEAGNSDAPTDSSSSSEQQSKPEASVPSTRVATSRGRVGTSSSRSTRH